VKKNNKFLYLSIVIIGIVFIFMFINKNDVSIQDEKKMRVDQIESVLQNGWDEFGLFSFEIGDTDSTIRIVMDETKSEQELRKYLEENIDKLYLEHYNIEISKRGLEEVETEMAMIKILVIVSNYINEKEYKGIEIMYPSIGTKSVLTIKNSETSGISNETLKNELESLIVSKSSELLTKDILYEIQVITQ
jgi:hypothetical protein